MDQQTATKLAAAVEYHRREVGAAETGVTNAEWKVRHMEGLLEGVRADLEGAIAERDNALGRLADADSAAESVAGPDVPRQATAHSVQAGAAHGGSVH